MHSVLTSSMSRDINMTSSSGECFHILTRTLRIILNCDCNYDIILDLLIKMISFWISSSLSHSSPDAPASRAAMSDELEGTFSRGVFCYRRVTGLLFAVRLSA